MNFLVFILLLVFLKKVNRDQRKSDIFKMVFWFYFICMFASAAFPPLTLVAVIGIIYYIVKKMRSSGKQPEPEQTYYRTEQDSSRKEPKKTKSSILPRPVTKRLKIVKAFNEKYNLTLTQEQMQRIVDSSYMSEAWKQEVEAMSQKYETIYEWFQGETRYLRAYIHAFEIQEISSDIWQQEQICIHAFQQVWDYADSLTNLTLEERITRVNNMYYTHFDNITFMIAYRFLEGRGYRHKLDTMDLVQEDPDLEKLKQKYRQAGGTGI